MQFITFPPDRALKLNCSARDTDVIFSVYLKSVWRRGEAAVKTAEEGGGNMTEPFFSPLSHEAPPNERTSLSLNKRRFSFWRRQKNWRNNSITEPALFDWIEARRALQSLIKKWRGATQR